jgi:hypothetical protein
MSNIFALTIYFKLINFAPHIFHCFVVQRTTDCPHSYVLDPATTVMKRAFLNNLRQTMIERLIPWNVQSTLDTLLRTDRSRDDKLWLVCGGMGDIILCDRKREITP